MVLVTGGIAVIAVAFLCCIMVWPIRIRYREWGWGHQGDCVLCQPGMECLSGWPWLGGGGGRCRDRAGCGDALGPASMGTLVVGT